ncbi:MAG: hypothetical protein KME15_20140 [Drouetiella hepatica Uher 2000/2452]|jgi:hypothetical protein|uniref:Uncharacterized protein n=1 Tax=Drouetiella hepatica Uher 2000/2452 TaxID=904376 RepID=A0A951QGW6_9CYAN|nr:hypothetical protein [Drouetiella hepatica Uher 2000/2452]
MVAINSDRQSKGRNAMTSMFGAALSLWFLNAAYTSPAAFIMRAFLFLSGSAVLSASVHRTVRHRLGPQDFWDGITEVLADDVAATGTLLLKSADRATAPLDRIVYDRLPASIQRSLPPASVGDTAWFEQVAFWRDSKFIFGRKGTGKSVLMGYESWVIKSTDPEAMLFVLDPHLDAESLWFGGNSELIKAHCYKSIQDFARIFDLVASELDDRKTQGDRRRPLCKIIADEWESIINGFASLPARFPEGDDRHDEAVKLSVYAEKIPAIAAFIQDEGQKFQVECTIGAHGGKTKRSGIDSDILLQMHWIACDDALTMPNTPLLQVVKGEAQKLEANRRRLLPYAGEHQKFAGTAILRCVKSRSKTEPCLKAVGLPWIDFEGAEVMAIAPEPVDAHVADAPQSEEEAWLQENRAKLVEVYRSGTTSLRKLCETFDVARDSRKGRLIADFLQQMRAIDDAELEPDAA